MTTDDFTEAARAEAESDLAHLRGNEEYADGYRDGHRQGSAWACTRLAAQEPTESVLMTSREETISDRLSDAGYTEYAEDEDGGVTWVSAPLGEVLRIVSAAQEPTDAEVEAASRTWAESGPTTAVWEQMAEERREYTRERMRACLSAARAARRDEEKR